MDPEGWVSSTFRPVCAGACMGFGEEVSHPTALPLGLTVRAASRATIIEFAF